MKKILSEKFFRKIGLLTVASILFLIFIGGLVRITGSGMGCPDWPKCFGYYIPPTNISELTWKPQQEFDKGQMIIKEKKLWVAQGNFTTAQQFSPSNWAEYTKHSYALYNPVHTYIEWVNRMVSVFVGLFMILTVLSSFQYWKKQKSIVFLCIASFLLTLFQAWLGAKVVESNLDGLKISIHMLFALVIVGFVMIAVFKNHVAQGLDRIGSLRWFKVVVYGVIVLTLVQIFYGTLVREAVDVWKAKADANDFSWVKAVNYVLTSHKSLSAFVMAAMLLLYFMVSNRLDKTNKVTRWIAVGMVLVATQIALGSVNIFFNMPAISQVLHVTLAGLLIASQFYVAILVYNYKGDNIIEEKRLND